MLGCYSFPMHVLVHHPDTEAGVRVRTVREALADTFQVTYALGCPVLGGEDADIEAAARAAADAEVCVVVLGDQAGLFGRGTSGEGCDVPDLRLPGRQEELLEALLATGTPVVAVLLVGRPYDLSRQVDRLAGLVCGFFPGEEGAQAIADVISGRVNPSGRLPVSFPGAGSTHPSTYLAPVLGRRNEVSMVDPTPLFAFGHGLSFADATWGAPAVTSGPRWETDGTCELVVPLANGPNGRCPRWCRSISTTDRPRSCDLCSSFSASLASTSPPGGQAQVRFVLHADLTSFTGRDLVRVVEPGGVELWVGASSTDIRATLPLELAGSTRVLDVDRTLEPLVTVEID